MTQQQFRPSPYSFLPPVVKNLLIINGIFFLAMIAMDIVWRIDLSKTLGLHYFKASDFHPYQLVTYMFMHGSFGHLFFNMFALWMFGSTMENVWGSKRFFIFYMVCGIGAGLVQEVSQHIYFLSELSNYTTVNLGGRNIVPMSEYLNMMTTVGASGAIYGLLLAFGMTFPNSYIYLYFFLPLKAKWFVMIYAAIELFSGFGGSADGVAHFAHLGGMLFGLVLILMWRNGNGSVGGFFDNIRRKMRNNDNRFNTYSRPKTDEQYNRERADDEAKTDEILEKIAKSGYKNLTDEEKEFLFRQSKKQ